MARFNREVIPERRMYAKGWGAYGKLTMTHDISLYTKAGVLQPGAATELFTRFSMVAGERGATNHKNSAAALPWRYLIGSGYG